ncbi:MAG: GAF domain-containing protein [Magnetococcus sp. YQC-3]
MLTDATSKKLLRIQLQLGSTRNFDLLPGLITAAAAELCTADRAALFLLDWERMELCSRAAMGIEGGIRLELKMGIVGLAFLRREIINVIDAYNVPFFNRAVDQGSGYKTETVLVLPILDERGVVLGAVQMLNKREGCFTQHDEEKLAGEVHAICTAAFFQGLEAGRVKPLVDRWVEELFCERGTFFVLNTAQGILHALYATGMENKPAIGIRVNLGIAGWVVFTGETLAIEDAYQSEFFNQESDRKTGYHTRNILAVPLKTSQGEPLGALEIINKKEGGSFTQEDRDALESLAAIAAIAMENALLFAEHDAQFHSFIEVLATSIDARDPLTTGHSRLVSEYACGIAQELGLPVNDVDVVRVAGYLHDYGKLGVTNGLLHKSGSVTSGEHARTKSYVDHTREILTKMRFSRKYRHIPSIAASHHEYMDGSGYGSGLLNRYIPFLAKIITVADIFETLTADRHYRKRMLPEEALAILKQGAGKKFDTAIVEAMGRYWQKRVGGVVESVQRLEDLPVTAMRSRSLSY